jgi:hypothetical protein
LHCLEHCTVQFHCCSILVQIVLSSLYWLETASYG